VEGGKAIGEGLGVNELFVTAKAGGNVAESPCMALHAPGEVGGGTDIEVAGQHFEDVDEEGHGRVLAEQERDRFDSPRQAWLAQRAF